MSKTKEPRWIKEIPGIIDTGQKRELMEQERKEAKGFERAVKAGKIEEWFNSTDK